jgi:hypothetical protein
MTTAEVLETPRPFVVPTYGATEHNNVTVTQHATDVSPPGDVGDARYSSAEMLEVALAAYEQGYLDAMSQAGRQRWHVDAERFRAARIQTEVRAMKANAARQHTVRGYPGGYDYRGGPVDFETGLPAGSGCAWLRHQRMARNYRLAGGEQ